MNIYLVKRTDSYSYDEYDSCVILANSEEEVEAMIAPRIYDKAMGCYASTSKIPNLVVSADSLNYCDNGLHEITLIGSTHLCERQIICSSFNAG